MVAQGTLLELGTSLQRGDPLSIMMGSRWILATTGLPSTAGRRHGAKNSDGGAPSARAGLTTVRHQDVMDRANQRQPSRRTPCQNLEREEADKGLPI